MSGGRRADPDSVIERLNAALESRYRIERELGEGGMATVYLAEDVRHDRKVAVKVLRPELAAVVGAERFLAEIRTTAALQHPHILPLHDSGEADGFLFYVMPYVEGESLRDRLDSERQLPVEEAVELARKVADALQYAHEQGVVHRDIKPANILLSRGNPLVADFGIALAVSQAGGGRITETGLSLGTPHYMSPEQASGERTVDRRSDVYSLGCVLYEMLAGEPPYGGPTSQAVLARILTTQPQRVSELRRTVPAHVDAAVAKALEKLPADRFDSAAEFAEALTDPAFRYTPAARPAGATQPAPASPAQTGAGPSRAAWLLGGLAALFAVLAFLGWLRPEPSPRVIRTDLDLGNLVLPSLERVVVSPDGSTFAVAAELNGTVSLYVRGAHEPDFRPMPGTEGAGQPAFSPDGEWIVYRDQDDDALRKVSLSGGAPLTVVATGAVSPWIPHWGDDGTIVFTGPDGIHRVSETGGTPTPIDGIEGVPRLLPGGRGLLVTENEDQSVQVLDFRTDSVRTLLAEGVSASYLPTGHLLYAHPDGGLQVVTFDLEALEVTGEPVPVQDGVGWAFTGAFYSVSDEGTLVYVMGRRVVTTAPGTGLGRLVVVDVETGTTEPVPLEPRPFGDPRYSPDGRYVVYSSGSPQQLYVYDMELGTTPRQLTFEGDNDEAVWSPDGTRLAFMSQREGSQGWDLYVKTAHDDTPEARILERPGFQGPVDWPEETLLLFEDNAESDRLDLWTVDPTGGGEPEPYLTAEEVLGRAHVSPDGRLAAYEQGEQGEPTIYVRSFPQPRQQSRVSPGGGTVPRWSPDGRTIYYWSFGAGDTLFAARVRTEPSFAVVGTDVVLTGSGYQRLFLDVHPDGDRLLVVDGRIGTAAEGSEPAEPERYVAVFNWFEELEQRTGQGR